MVQIFSTTITPDAGINMALTDEGYAANRAQILMLRGDDIRGVVTINACFYLEEADLLTGTEFLLGTIGEELVRPNGYIVVPGAKLVTGSMFHNTGGAPFGGVQVLGECTISISPNGGIFARITSVTTPATLAAVDYVLVPVNVTYTKLVEVNVET